MKEIITGKMTALRASLLSILLCLTVAAWADNGSALVLHTASGGEIVYVLDEKPVVTFRGDELVITTHMNAVSYPASNVRKFTYTWLDEDAINDVQSSRAIFSIKDGRLTAAHLAPHSAVSVYSTDGILITSTSAGADGSVSIMLPAQSGHTFVIKTLVANFKISMP